MKNCNIIYEGKKAMKKRFPAFLLFAVLLLASVLPLFSCGGGRVLKKEVYGRFDTVCTLYDYSGDGDFDKKAALFVSLLSEYDAHFDIYGEGSPGTIAYLNHMAGQGRVSVLPDVEGLLRFGTEVFDMTRGAVNIALGAVTFLWHDARYADTPYLPSETDISEAMRHCSMDNLSLPGDGTAAILDAAMSLDVGAIAKGYAAELIAGKMESTGYTSLVIDLGGNLRAIGTRPGGAGFETGIKNPLGSGYSARLTLSDDAVATSGAYERKLTVDGREYGHITDPVTGYPADNFASVSVTSPDAGMADALSTALFILSYEDGVALLSYLARRGVSGAPTYAVWVMKDGSVRKIAPPAQ